jgi:hypothetical protein
LASEAWSIGIYQLRNIDRSPEADEIEVRIRDI